MRLTNSLAVPSSFRSSVIVISKATVNGPDVATNQPSISLDVISTSDSCNVIISPLISISKA